MTPEELKRQTELLEKEDSRFYKIDRFNTGTASVATTENFDGNFLNFGLPSSPGLFLSLALNFQRKVSDIDINTCFDKHPHPQGTYPNDHKNLFDFFELMIGQIIFSYTAIETFANIMIPKDYEFQSSRIRPKQTEIYNKDQVERKVSLNEKLRIILPEILSVNNPAQDNKLWGEFTKLEELRDRLIHLKSVDMKPRGPEINTIWGDLMRVHKINFTSQAHELIGHFIANKNGFRWFKKFPY